MKILIKRLNHLEPHRTYNSQADPEAGFESVFGPGWQGSFEERCLIEATNPNTNDVDYIDPSATEYKFEYSSGYTAPLATGFQINVSIDTVPDPDLVTVTITDTLKIVRTFQCDLGDTTALLTKVTYPDGSCLIYTYSSGKLSEILFSPDCISTTTLVSFIYTVSPPGTDSKLDITCLPLTGTNQIQLSYNLRASDKNVDSVQLIGNPATPDNTVTWRYEYQSDRLSAIVDANNTEIQGQTKTSITYVESPIANDDGVVFVGSVTDNCGHGTRFVWEYNDVDNKMLLNVTDPCQAVWEYQSSYKTSGNVNFGGLDKITSPLCSHYNTDEPFINHEHRTETHFEWDSDTFLLTGSRMKYHKNERDLAQTIIEYYDDTVLPQYIWSLVDATNDNDTYTSSDTQRTYNVVEIDYKQVSTIRYNYPISIKQYEGDIIYSGSGPGAGEYLEWKYDYTTELNLDWSETPEQRKNTTKLEFDYDTNKVLKEILLPKYSDGYSGGPSVLRRRIDITSNSTTGNIERIDENIYNFGTSDPTNN